MDDRQRERLLGRLRRPSGAIGAGMPDEITVDGTTVDLTELLFERERLERRQRIADGELSYEAGERLAEEVRGIDRAIAALEGVDEPDIGEQLRQKELEDARELLAMVRQLP